ncbi:MAG: carboxypeptidase-like regulatory domain-containing protein [Sphingobacteriales bacterium]|nr:MAG: carboxypeptidase-like regulatory domain-containing protein [Sphingobacteriales bacterium]
MFILCVLATPKAFAQDPYENIIQINGVTMTADSLRAVPGVTVLVLSKDRGVESSGKGVFSIVVYKGDTLQFSALGFRNKQYVVPKDLKGHYFSLIQLMVQDTFYLPETIIRPVPSREQFDYAFKHWSVPDDQLELARRNTNALTLRALAYTMPRDGRENQAAYQNQQAVLSTYYGQQKPMNIFNPLAWAEFYEAWKRGDYRKKNRVY